MTGLIGIDSALTLNAGKTDKLTVGLNDASAPHKLNVRSLAVQTAGSATMYGSIDGQSGAQAAALVDSRLIEAPYFINDTPWGPVDNTPVGPLEIITTLAAVTTPANAVPGRLQGNFLLSRRFSVDTVVPHEISVFAGPEVLTVLNEASQTTDGNQSEDSDQSED